MKRFEELNKILYVFFYNRLNSIKETLQQFTKMENLIVIFIALILLSLKVFNTLNGFLVIILLGTLFLITIIHRLYKQNKNIMLHEYKVIKGLNWKDKLKQYREKEVPKEEVKNEQPK